MPEIWDMWAPSSWPSATDTPTNLRFGFEAVPSGSRPKSLAQILTDQIFADRARAALGQATTPPAPHLRFNFDTIGQTIFRSIGHCRLPLLPIWAQGIEESGDETTSPTQTFAGALCAPLDADEDGEVFSIWDSDTLVMNAGATIHPLGWSAEDAALLSASLAGITIFPGNEAQLPASVIVADKGAHRTNAFRGLRYVIVPNYPIFGGSGSGSGAGNFPNLSFQIRRRNDGGEPLEQESLAAEFLAGDA